MATFVHPTPYRFYMMRTPSDDKVYAEVDIEMMYFCRFMRFENFEMDGDISNIYTETFAEMDGDRVYVPDKSDLAHKSYECKLRLLFTGDDVQKNSKKFADDWMGVKCYWFDTFRNKVATLLMTKAPNIIRQRLYGQKYAEIEFTFTNIVGVTHDEIQYNLMKTLKGDTEF